MTFHLYLTRGIFGGCLCLSAAFLAGVDPLPTATAAHLRRSFADLPLRFEENRGQTDPRVSFLASGAGYTLFLTPRETVLALNARPDAPGAVVRMSLPGGRPPRRIDGVQASGTSNFYLGNDPAHWHTAIPAYREVREESVYPGVDLVFYGNRQSLEYDFVLAPAADPSQIALRFAGADSLRLDSAGDLLVQAGHAALRIHKPVVYQDDGVRRTRIAAGYVLRAQNQVSFHLGSYDSARPLVIDPQVSLLYSTWLGGKTPAPGGTGGDIPFAVAVDGSGDAYVVGWAGTTDFPTAGVVAQPTLRSLGPGLLNNAFVAKLNPTGTNLIFSTYLGGTGRDAATSVAVDAGGNAYVAGWTTSADFPTLNPLGPPVDTSTAFASFVARFAPDGSLQSSTYLNLISDSAYTPALGVDAQSNIYVAGITPIKNFSTTPGAYNNCNDPLLGTSQCTFVTKIAAGASGIVYSALMDHGVHGEAMAVDAAGNVYLTGSTVLGLKTVNAFQPSYHGKTVNIGGTTLGTTNEAFVLKLAPDGSAPVYATYLGGSTNDDGRAIAVDSSGNAYVTGYTLSTDFPLAGPIQKTIGDKLLASSYGSAFVSKISADGSKLLYSTYLGGNGDDTGLGIAVNAAGEAYVTGQTSSKDFPVVSAYQSSVPGNFIPGVVHPGFVTKVNAGGSAWAYSTYMGGFGIATSTACVGIAVDGTGAYVVGFMTSDFPTTPGVFEPASPAPPGPIGQLGGAPIVFKLGDPPAGAPSISGGGVVEAANGGPKLTAGSIASIYGSNLAVSAVPVIARDTPLPTLLGATSVRVNGEAAPLYFVAPGQINFQVPWDIQGALATVTVTVNGQTGNAQTAAVAPAAPAIFDLNAAGQGAIFDSQTYRFAAPASSIPGATTQPIARGGYLTIYCQGLGAVSNAPASGAPGPSSEPLARTNAQPSVMIGGVPAQPILFSGLAPALVGLYQINVQVPSGAPSGNAVPVVVSIGGVSSKPATIAIQ